VESSSGQLVLTPDETRKLLRCSRSVLYAGLKNGSIPCIHLGPRKIIIPKHSFMEWLNQGGGNDLHPPE